MEIGLQNTALIMIDVQNDFCPSYIDSRGSPRAPGVLAVREGDKIVQPLNTVSEYFYRNGRPVVATQDWHPAGHVSFASSHPGAEINDIVKTGTNRKGADSAGSVEQVLWPDHCVQGSPGADFHDLLELNPVSCIIRKGMSEWVDSYSAFFDNDHSTATGLDGFLKSLGIKKICIGGLATDYCILYSAIDAVRLGYEVAVFEDAVRGVGFPAGSIENAIKTMRGAGVRFLNTQDILSGSV